MADGSRADPGGFIAARPHLCRPIEKGGFLFWPKPPIQKKGGFLFRQKTHFAEKGGGFLALEQGSRKKYFRAFFC